MTLKKLTDKSTMKISIKTPYSRDDIDVLTCLQDVTTVSVYCHKNENKTPGYYHTNNHTIDEDRQATYEDDYLFRNELSSEEFTELEKANSFIYATFITHRCDYTDISFGKRLEIFDTLWQVVFGEKSRACYLEIIKDLPQDLYSIEIVRNFPNEGRRETLSLKLI